MSHFHPFLSIVSVISIAMGSGLIPSPPTPITSETKTPLPELEKSIEYIQSDTPSEAIRIINQKDKITQPYALSQRLGPCTLIPRNIHVRTRTNNGDARVIGFKPVTICNHKVQSIRHESRLKYKYYLWWKDASLKHGVPTRSTNRGATRLEQKNIEFQCKGLVNTSFIGNTVGTVVANGVTYHAVINTDTFRTSCRA